MFKSQQYRAKAAEHGELIKRSVGPAEIRKFQQLQDRLASLADNEQGLADDYDNAVHVAEQDGSSGAALAAEEELVLRCLGAAIIMQWNALPTMLRRERFSTLPGRSASYWRRRRSAGKSPDFCTSTRMMPVAANCP
jgi:hypothetical protein